MPRSLKPPRGIFIGARVLFDRDLSPNIKETLLQLMALTWGNDFHFTPPLTYPLLEDLTGKDDRTLRGHLSALRHFHAALRSQYAGDGRFVFFLADWLFQDNIPMPEDQADAELTGGESGCELTAGSQLPVGGESLPESVKEEEEEVNPDFNQTEDINLLLLNDPDNDHDHVGPGANGPAGAPASPEDIGAPEGYDPVDNFDPYDRSDPVERYAAQAHDDRADRYDPPECYDPPSRYDPADPFDPADRYHPPRGGLNGSPKRPAGPSGPAEPPGPRSQARRSDPNPPEPPGSRSPAPGGRKTRQPALALDPEVQARLVRAGLFPVLLAEVAQRAREGAYTSADLLALLVWCQADQPENAARLFMGRLRAGGRAPTPPQADPPCPRCGLVGKHAPGCPHRYLMNE